MKIDKKFSADGGKIPDVVMRDDKNKIIHQFEGKKFDSVDKGLEEIKHFDLFENRFLKKYYPEYKYKRSLIVNGGNKKNIDKIEFQIDKNYNLIFKDKINFSF